MDRCLPLETLVESAALRVLRAAVEAHETCPMPSPSVLVTLESWLQEQASGASLRSQAALRAVDATDHVLAAGSTRIDAHILADMAGVSSRQLLRDFMRWFGVSPSMLLRLARLRRTMEDIALQTPLAVTAASRGYADQSHMGRELRCWTGLNSAAMRTVLDRPGNRSLFEALGAYASD